MSGNQTKARLMGIFRFAVTGGGCFLVELAALILLRDALLVGALGVEGSVATMIATPVAFLISVAVHYLLCLVWVFQGSKQTGAAAKAGFLASSLVGLLLNSLLMAIFGAIFGEDAVLLTLMDRKLTMYMVNKAMATLLVMVWNYFAKRAVLRAKS